MKKLFTTVFKIILFFIGWAVLAGIADIPSSEPAVWRFFAELIPFVVMVFFTVVFLLFEKDVKIPVRNNIVKGSLTGTVTGVIWISAVSMISVLSGQLSVTGSNSISFLRLWIISAFINVMMQELLVRGYIYQLLKKRYNLPAAVIVTTILFTAMHGAAIEAGIIPVINVVTMCLFTTALYESENTLAAPIMAHAVWNIIGSLFLGCVDLADDYPHLLNVNASDNTLLSGGAHKLEASIIVTVINTVLMILFLYKCRSPKSNKQ